MTRKLHKQSQSVSECPLYGTSPLLLAQTFPMDPKRAARWKAELRRVPDNARRIQLFVDRDLGAFDSRWLGFRVVGEGLHTPAGYAIHPAEVLALPFYHSQLAGVRAALRAAERRLEDLEEGPDVRDEALQELLLRALHLVRR